MIEHVDGESWKIVPDFEKWRFDGRYSASDLGRVRSNGFVVDYRNGLRVRKPSKILRDYTLHYAKRDYRYRKVNLYGVGSKMVSRGVHQLVMLAFVGPPPDGLVINHKDGDPTNNRLDNLEYVTNRENLLHAVAMGLMTGLPGESNPMALLSVEQVMEIKYLIRLGYSNTQIGRHFNVCGGTIQLIRSERNWPDVPEGDRATCLVGIERPRGGPTRNIKGRGRLVEPS